MRFLLPVLALMTAVTPAFAAPEAEQAPLSAPASHRPPHFEVIRGLLPFSALGQTPSGEQALEANAKRTADIQTGVDGGPRLEPFAQAQQRALRDAFITAGNGAGLADGLGTKLGAAYQALASYTSAGNGKTASYTSVSPAFAALIKYTSSAASYDAGSAKLYFAGGMLPAITGQSFVTRIAALRAAAGGVADVYGKAYHLPAGSAGGDPYGDPRPFQALPHLTTYTGADYFGAPSSSTAYLRGPAQDAQSSPAFPSGHTAYAFTDALLLAFMVPERYPQLIARAAEYGNSRIILGAHYAMDVIAGRTLAYYDVAQMLAQRKGFAPGINEKYLTFMAATRTGVRKNLAAACEETLARCAAADTGRFSNPQAVADFYGATLGYGLPVVFAHTATRREDVASLAPEAGYLLTAAFPSLTLAQADALLTRTEAPGGGFLDNGTAFGLYSRLDLYRAALAAQQITSLLDPRGE